MWVQAKGLKVAMVLLGCLTEAVVIDLGG